MYKTLLWSGLCFASIGQAMELDLAQAVKIAKEHNESLLNSHSQSQSAQIQSSLARTSLGPTLTAGSDISHSKRLDEQASGSRWGADLTLSQSIDFSQFSMAKSKALSAQASRIQSTAVESQLIGSVILSYLQFLRDSLYISVAEQDLKNQQEKGLKILAEVQVGNKSGTESLQQEALIAQAETELLQRIRTAQDSKSNFISLLGLPLSSDTVDIIASPKLLLQTLVDIEAGFHPDDSLPTSSNVESQAMRIQAAQASLNANQLRKMPTLSFSAGLNHDDPLWSDPPSNTESSQYLKLQARVQWRILDGGERSAQIQQDQLTLEDALRTKSQLQREEQLALEQAKRQLQISLAKNKSAQKSLVASQKALESQRVQYDLGGISLLDLRQAEQQELSAQATLLQSQFESLNAYAQVRNAQNRIPQVLSEFSAKADK